MSLTAPRRRIGSKGVLGSLNSMKEEMTEGLVLWMPLWYAYRPLLRQAQVLRRAGRVGLGWVSVSPREMSIVGRVLEMVTGMGLVVG